VAPETHQPGAIGSELSRMTGASTNAPPGISKTHPSHWNPPGVSERMWSVDLDVSMSGEYRTLGGHYIRPSERLGVVVSSLGAPATCLRAPRITVEQSRKNNILFGNAAGGPVNYSYYLSFNDF